jgi:O-antigen ligase
MAAVTLALLCVPPPPNPETQTLDISAADVGAVLLVALVAARLLVLRPRISLSPAIAVGAAASLVAYFLTTLLATDWVTSLPAFVRYTEVFVLVPVAVALSIERRSDLVVILGTLVVVGLVEGGIGAYQYATGTGAGFGAEGIRAVGTFGAYDIMGMAIVVSCALLAVLAVSFGARANWRALSLAVAPLLVVPLVLSLSRGAWLAVIVAVVAMAIASGVRRFLVSVAVVAVVVIVGLGIVRPDLGIVGERASSVLASPNSPDRSVHDRYDLWTAAFAMWRDHPLTGVGMKNFFLWRDAYAPVSLSSGSEISDPQGGSRRVALLSPHNQYLLTLSEQGLVGMAAFAWLFLAVLARTVRRLARTPPGTSEQVIGIFAIGVLVRYLVSSVWGDIGGPTSVLGAVLLGVAFWFASAPRAPEQPPLGSVAAAESTPGRSS